MIDPETEYLIARAKQEAAMAARAKHPAAAAAHRGIYLRYSAQAVMELAQEATDRVENRQRRPVESGGAESG